MDDMKYALITCINGNFKVESEHGSNIEQARTAFYSKCTALSNAPDVIKSQVAVVDIFLNPVMGLKADIGHDAKNEE